MKQIQRGLFMRGGKREGAGRKGYGKTKMYRLPVALDDEIQALLKKHKANFNAKKETFDCVSNSKEPIKPIHPILNKEELKCFRHWLIKRKHVKSMSEARKLTNTPRLCHETFIKYIPWEDEKTIDALNIECLCNIYAVE